MLMPLTLNYYHTTNTLKGFTCCTALQGAVLRCAGKTKAKVRDVAFAQARHPLNYINYYFKTTILKAGTESFIAIGLTCKVHAAYLATRISRIVADLPILCQLEYCCLQYKW